MLLGVTPTDSEKEIIRLLSENNQMLKYICAYIASQGSTGEQDNKNLMINIIADLLVDELTSNKK